MERTFILLVKLSRCSLAFAIVGLCTAAALPAQTFTTLVSLNGTDGYVPSAAMVQGADGNFYEADLGGGSEINFSCSTRDNCGTIFEITSGGALTTLRNFNYTNGASPAAGLILAANGTFYGTTEFGGVGNSGTIFKMSPAGKLTTLYDSSCSLPCPYWFNGLIEGANGDCGTSK